jgi:hypothetical protein
MALNPLGGEGRNVSSRPTRLHKDNQLVRSYAFRTSRMHDVHDVRRRGAQYGINLPKIDEIFILIRKLDCNLIRFARTPMPLKKRQTKLRTKPNSPSTYLNNNPEISTERGTKNKAPYTAARRRSSGYHTPPRLARHRTTILSDIRPARGAPTVNKE